MRHVAGMQNFVGALQNDGKAVDGELAPVEPEAKIELCAGIKLAGNSWAL